MNQHNPESNITSLQTSDPDKFTSDGMTFRRRGGKKYSVRIKFRGKTHWITLAETKTESIRGAKLARKEIWENRWAEFRQSTQLRSDHPKTALSVLYTAYRRFPGNLSAKTKEKNIQALGRILAVVKPGQACSVEDLTSDLLWEWKQEVLNQSNQAEGDRSTQLRRSANSTLHQARSLFSRDACEYYRRTAKIHLPETLDGFRNETGFKKVDKIDYRAPADGIIGATLRYLDAITGVGHEGPVLADTTEDSLNVYKACWLAIGFGLRASEIGKCKNGDFKRIDGDIFFRPDWRAKNKRMPEIGVQLNAWQRLAKWIENQPADAFVLSGNETERTSMVFRRISDRMKQFGWQTTHHTHELRAWAGCQIAEKHGHGLLAAQAFMRHSSYTTTQKYYGHHLKVRMDKVRLTIPPLEGAFRAEDSISARQLSSGQVPCRFQPLFLAANRGFCFSEFATL